MYINQHKLEKYFESTRTQKLPLELEDVKNKLAQSANPSVAGRRPVHKQRLPAFVTYLPESTFILCMLTLMAVAVQKEALVLPGKNKQSNTITRPHPQLSQHGDSVIENKPSPYSPGRIHTNQQTESIRLRTNRKEKHVFTFAANYAPPIHFVQLPVPILEKLGFRLGTDEIEYHTIFSSEETNGKPMSIWLKVASGKTQIGGILSDSTGLEPTHIPKPLFITDITGQQQLFKYRTHIEDARKMEPDYFNEVANLLVPVLISVSSKTGKHEAVFWFKPTPEFLSELPALMAQEIKSEYERIQLMKEAKKFQQGSKDLAMKESFKYFESAGASTSAYPINLFPNPARDRVHLSLTLDQPQHLRVVLVDLNGRVMKVFAPLGNVPAGPFSAVYSLAGIPPGLYVFVIETANGGKQLQRLVVE